MKKLIMFFAAVFSLLVAQAQAPVYNPYLSAASVSPAPLAPVEFNGTGVLTFTIGNGGTDGLLWDPAIPNNDMIVVITLSRGVPNVPTLDATTALDALGGTFSSMFDWTYDVATNTYNGRQVQTIAAGASGTIVIQYKVTENSFQLGPQNGFNVNLTPPPIPTGRISLRMMPSTLIPTQNSATLVTLLIPIRWPTISLTAKIISVTWSTGKWATSLHSTLPATM